MPAAAVAWEGLRSRAEAPDKPDTLADPPDEVAPVELTREEPLEMRERDKLEAGAARRTAGLQPPSGRAADPRSR
jgi:hypothetical protein